MGRIAFSTGVLALLAFAFGPPAVGAQASGPGSSFDVRAHGYEHGYRDGYTYGMNARAQGAPLDFHTQMYTDARNGYDPAFGSQDKYQQGYRQGYEAGAQDAYSGSRNGLERTYGSPNYVPPPAYAQPNWPYQDVAGDVGYHDGVSAGLKDFHDRHSYRPEKHDQYEDASHGYHSSYGNKDAYKAAYRQGYLAGYQAGYGTPQPR